MKVEQLYTGCLAEAAYYIESNGEAAIIDPLREVDQYIEMANKRGAKIKYVLETHFHADFVSGHIDLAEKIGAMIVYGPTAEPNFSAHIAHDGEELALGNMIIKVLHTPGHTMESSSFLLLDENNEPHSIYTGDTLFIGDVGRPDLAVQTDLTQEDLAGHLFDSLRDKIMTLPASVIVYPGHGQGSACGKNMSKETFDTLGNQLKSNYALRADMSKQEFIKAVTDGLVAPPQYFPKNAVMNKTGYNSIESILERGLTPLNVSEFEEAMKAEGAVILDTRNEREFTNAYIPNSIFIGIDGTFAPWVGVLIEDLNAPILIISDAGREEEIVTRLARVGYDNSVGFLDGGFKAWKDAGKRTDSIRNVLPEDFEGMMHLSNTETLDVRKASEFESQHLEGVTNFPLDFIYKNLSQLNEDKNYIVHCAGGYRSVAAASILKQNGIDHVTNVLGGFGAIVETGKFKTTAFHEVANML
jgi:hydroxyacylglutathione hydrolase